MKKPLCIILSVLFLLSLTACGGKTIYFDKEMEEEAAFTKTITAHFPLNMELSARFGTQTSSFTIDENGSFSGTSTDLKTSESTDEYPDGTIYISTFSGEFANFQVINDYTYTFYIYNLETERSLGEEWIEGSVRYVAAEPTALADNDGSFTLYTPETPKAALPVSVLGSITEYSTSDTLNCYALLNNKTGDVFFQESNLFQPEHYGH